MLLAIGKLVIKNASLTGPVAPLAWVVTQHFCICYTNENDYIHPKNHRSV